MTPRYFTETQVRRRLVRAFPYASEAQINNAVAAFPKQEVTKLLIPETALAHFVAEQEFLFCKQGYDEMGGVR